MQKKQKYFHVNVVFALLCFSFFEYSRFVNTDVNTEKEFFSQFLTPSSYEYKK